MIESELIQLTAKAAKCSEDEVRKALQMYSIYKKIRQQERQKAKALRREALRNLGIRKLKNAYPDRCFCTEDGIDVKRSVSDEIIGHKKAFSPLRGWFIKPIYACSNCGKEYHETIILA
jgi:hypothetical protein